MAGSDLKAQGKMKPKFVKSQITIILIVGLVVFIIIGLVLYISKSAVKQQVQQNVKRVQTTAIETKPVKELVAKCMDKLAKDAIVLLGKQGGYIYSSQGGTLVDYSDTDEGLFFIKHNNLNVAYNIIPPKFAVSPYSSETPDYPWVTFPYRSSTSSAEIFEGFFGISTIPPLNSSEGPNSIQSQIESFIDNNMESCASFDIFSEQSLEVTMNNSKTQVIIGSKDVIVKSKIPITITNTVTNEYAEISDFSTNIDIRLRDIYFFAKALIESDTKNIKFNISNINNNKDFLSVRLVENAFSNDDLIVVMDEKSLVYGRPYEYIFGRKNRAPALYYIRKTSLQFPNLHVINQSDILQGSKLAAEDPDEDSYTFTITPAVPKTLNVPQVNFKVEVSDGRLSDYQTITVNRI